MAPELGARDLVRLLPARGSFFLFGSSRKCDRIFGHSLLNAGQFTKSRKPSAIDAASPPVSFAQENSRCRARFPAATLRSPPFKYDLVGPPRGALPIIFAADSPGQQRQPE
jgi:hypothetical protein